MTLQDAIQVVRQALHHAPGPLDYLFLMTLSQARDLLRKAGLMVPPKVDELLRAGVRTTVGKMAGTVESLAFLEALDKHAQGEGLISQQLAGSMGGLGPVVNPLLGIMAGLGVKGPAYDKTRSNSMWASMERRLRRS